MEFQISLSDSPAQSILAYVRNSGQWIYILRAWNRHIKIRRKKIDIQNLNIIPHCFYGNLSVMTFEDVRVWGLCLKNCQQQELKIEIFRAL